VSVSVDTNAGASDSDSDSGLVSVAVHPDVPIVGEACSFNMTLNDLGTVMEHRLPIKASVPVHLSSHRPIWSIDRSMSSSLPSICRPIFLSIYPAKLGVLRRPQIAIMNDGRQQMVHVWQAPLPPKSSQSARPATKGNGDAHSHFRHALQRLINKYETHIKAYYTHYALSTYSQAHIKSL
jgi:hypothetical protein